MKEKSAMFDPVKFVEWAVWYANKHDAKITPVRIVKFLYLADLYHARIAEGLTLTGWKWTFIHYGPFCSESLQVLEKAERMGLIEGPRIEANSTRTRSCTSTVLKINLKITRKPCPPT